MTEGIPVESHVLLSDEFWPWRTDTGSPCARCKELILTNWDLKQMHKPSSAIKDAPRQSQSKYLWEFKSHCSYSCVREVMTGKRRSYLFMKGYMLLSLHRARSCSTFLQLTLLLSAMVMHKQRRSQEKYIMVAGLGPRFFLKCVCPEALHHICHKASLAKRIQHLSEWTWAGNLNAQCRG